MCMHIQGKSMKVWVKAAATLARSIRPATWNVSQRQMSSMYVLKCQSTTNEQHVKRMLSNKYTSRELSPMKYSYKQTCHSVGSPKLSKKDCEKIYKMWIQPPYDAFRRKIAPFYPMVYGMVINNKNITFSSKRGSPAAWRAASRTTMQKIATVIGNKVMIT